MGVGFALSMAILFLASFSSISVGVLRYSEFHPPDNGGPDGSASSGTHLVSEG